jgi:hypothetical protein
MANAAAIPPSTGYTLSTKYVIGPGFGVGGTPTADGPPSLTFYDGDKKSRATIVIHKDNPFIILKDGNGNLRWSAFVTERGPYLGLSDSKGTVRWSVSVDDGGAHVRAFDASGKELPTQK